MANYQHKRSQVVGKVPLAGDLLEGEVAVNIKDRKLFSKDDQGVVFEFLGGNSGGVETVNGISPVSGNVTLNALNIPPTADRLWLTQAERQLIAGFDAYDKTESDDRYLLEANNLSDLTNAATARTNLGLGTAATRDVGESAGNLMEVGAFGVGAVVIPTATQQEIDDYTFGKNLSTYGIAGPSDLPAGTYLITVYRYSSNNVHQVIRKVNVDDTSYERILTSSTGITPWKRIYNSGNILGTVSQSGGVPTGAIIERGSNVNGEYVRYADGTMICKYLGDTNTSAIYPQTHSWNSFPSTFQDNPTILCQGISWRGGDIINYHYTDARMAGRGDFSSGVAVCQVFTTSRDGGNPTNVTRIMWQAIGRWF